ncbi:Tripartite ATP-independent periplasmic transporter, DctQ component [Pseudovibrio axinellae]|uniref:TRAP transporter small permease protein n=1 Tax=Pseudovibrio axinellae TaxID=989403 RepID=A0A165SX23_9HYPH|nr:TRAP transporter small permease [Pseudovibrio axinellae]KZL04597.1 Tripartite ATP-independent periplasmic transporter, DctQ component [Pseudovibrio axinellae]SEQ71852.1 TRAP-type C4-dicarboxylate transport system, small permease component [Pseudovibrio axinellae]
MSILTSELPKTVAKPLNGIIKLMNFMITAGGVIMALTFFMVVIVRYGFSGNLFAYEEWLMMISFWMFFMAAAVASARKEHVNADVLGFLISNPRIIWWRELVVEIIEITVLSVVTYWGFLMLQEEIASYPMWQTTVGLKIPFFVPRLGIFLGFFFMTIFAVLHFYLLLRNGPKWPEREAREIAERVVPDDEPVKAQETA